MAKGKQNKERLSSTRVVEELVAIGFARVTDFLCVKDGEIVIKDALSPQTEAAIASIERTNHGWKVKFYDKLKALELLGKHLGIFDGEGAPAEENNLLEQVLRATGEEVDICDIPELQQAAAAGHDLVE